ncbi:MAG: SIMPL domain-containing protein [Actinomycetes bacterium]
MTETVITVQGTARAEYAPERGILIFTIAADGPDRADAVDRATAALDRVSTAIAARHDAHAGPVTAWSADRVSVRRRVPGRTTARSPRSCTAPRSRAARPSPASTPCPSSSR